MINKPLFEIVKEQILAEPKLVNMGTFCNPNGHRIKNSEKFDHCGTVGCIAGHAMFAMGLKKSLVKQSKTGETEFQEAGVPYVFEDTVAGALLGISNAEAQELFYFYSKGYDESPSPYAELARELKAHKPGSQKYAKVVVKAIDLCLERYKTGVNLK